MARLAPAAVSTAPARRAGALLAGGPGGRVLAPCESDNKNQSWVPRKAKLLELGRRRLRQQRRLRPPQPERLPHRRALQLQHVYQQWSVEAHSDGTTIIHATSTGRNGGQSAA